MKWRHKCTFTVSFGCFVSGWAMRDPGGAVKTQYLIYDLSHTTQGKIHKQDGIWWLLGFKLITHLSGSSLQLQLQLHWSLGSSSVQFWLLISDLNWEINFLKGKEAISVQTSHQKKKKKKHPKKQYSVIFQYSEVVFKFFPLIKRLNFISDALIAFFLYKC